MQPQDTVLVTGANGFIATHCILRLLKAGYRVRGTLRSLARTDHLREVFRHNLDPNLDLTERLTFVEADLARDEGWVEAVAGCKYVLHVASPVPTTTVKNRDDLITPAREGTLRVLNAATGQAQRVVITSSIAAVLYGHKRDGSEVYDESHWSSFNDTIGAYEQSKTVAERAAWEYVASLPADSRLSLVAINPGAVLGPGLDANYSVSGEIVRKLLAREIPGCPDMGWALVDVRDVADAHVAALTVPEADGQRFILGTEHVSMLEIAKVLSKHFGPLGFKVPVRRVPDWVLKVLALWDKTVALAVHELGKRQDVSTVRARTVLGWTSRTPEEMIVDMAESMIQHKIVALPRTGLRAA